MFGPAPVFSLGILFHSFRFLDSAGRATCTPSTSADFSPLIFCGSVTGRLHAGDPRRLSHLIGFEFCDVKLPHYRR